MTTQLEQAARQALEALETSGDDYPALERKAITAIRAALEHPSNVKQVIELYDSPQQPAQDEPVAWVWFNDRGECREVFTRDMKKIFPNYSTEGMTPLYTRPQAREPLFDKDTQRALDIYQAAHGIKGEA